MESINPLIKPSTHVFANILAMVFSIRTDVFKELISTDFGGICGNLNHPFSDRVYQLAAHIFTLVTLSRISLPFAPNLVLERCSSAHRYRCAFKYADR